MKTVAALDQVVMRYGRVTALDRVSFGLEAGSVVALVGHNGAGKTTVLKLVLGLIQPTEGIVRVLGGDPAGGKGAAIRKRIGFLPETTSFHAAMTGRELLAFYAGLKGAVSAQAADILSHVGLDHAADRRVGTYSKGMRQRLGMAQALLGDPELVLLDEPTSGLDPNSRLQVYQTIEALKARGKSILVSTHALTEIEAHADKVVLIHEGRVLAAGTLQGLRDGARLPTVARLTVREGWEAEGLTAAGTGIHLDRQADKVTVAVPQGGMSAFLDMLARMRPWVAEVEIAPPTLDRLYQHLLAEAGSAR